MTSRDTHTWSGAKAILGPGVARTRAALVGISLVVGLPLIGPPASAQEAPIQTAGNNAVKDSYIVVLKDDVPLEAVDDRVRGMASRHRAKVEGVYRSAIRGFSATMSEQRARQLAAEADVAYIEQDQVVKASVDQSGPPWGLDRVDERALPMDQTYSYDATGSNVSVYIIDTGIRIGHDDFGDRASYGRDTVNDDDVASDCNGHGTHVAGTVGGVTHGVAKGVKLIAVKVLSCEGRGTTSTVVQGVDWVTGHHVKPAVANMSLGIPGGSLALDTAVRASIAAGVTYAVSAGNDDVSACSQSPARVAGAITVGATGGTEGRSEADARADFSNFGSCLDLFAPGVKVRSAWNSDDTATLSMNGTSMAAPHVTGAAALYLSKRPAATPGQVTSFLFYNATTGKVTDPGVGSPNRLLYRVHGPVITSLRCEAGSGQLRCTMQHSSGAPSSIRWYYNGARVSGWDGDKVVVSACTPGSVVQMRVVVTDVPGGSVDQAAQSVLCRNIAL